METLSEKYNISTKTISRMLKSDNVLVKSDNNIPCQTENIPSLDKNIPSYEEDYDPDYDYDDDANDLLEEYFKTHDRNDVSGIYFDENGKLKLKK